MGQRTNRIQLTKEEQNARILELQIDGYSERQIAEKVGLGKSTVNRRIKALLEQFKEENKDKLKNHKFVQLARLEKTIRVAVEGYELSLTPKKTLQTKDGSNDKLGAYREDSETIEDPRGNPSFLKAIIEAVKEQNKLLNLYDVDLETGEASELLEQIREITGRASSKYGDS